MWYLIIFLRKFDVILNMPWIKNHDVIIDEDDRFLLFKFNFCLINYLAFDLFNRVFNRTQFKNRLKKIFFKDIFSHWKKNDDKYKDVNAKMFFTIIEKENHEIVIMWFQHFDMLNQSKNNDRYTMFNNFIVDFFVIFVDDFDKFFAKH